MKSAVFLFTVIGLFLASCGNVNNEKSDEKVESEIHDEHQLSGEQETLELNNGERWKVNPEMIPYILKGERLINQYNNGDYKLLAKQLKASNSSLIESCTMVGKSHDELHKWLLPHIELLDKLEKTESVESKVIINELKLSFNAYHTYFQ